MTRLRREARAFVELFALCGFAITQPVLDIFGRAVTQFAFRGANGRDVIAFALVVTVAPALCLWVVEAAVGLALPMQRRVLHLALVAMLVGVFVVQAGRPLVEGAPLFALATLAAAAAAVLYVRAAPARQWLSFAALAPVAFAGLFLFTSPTGKLVGDGAVSQAGVAVGAPTPVVVLVLDELPLASLIGADGEIDGELYPNLAELAGTSHWFRNTTTVTGATFHAVPSILTGKLPDGELWPVSADHPDSLFTLLGGAMPLNVTETVTRVCPARLCELAEPPSQVLRDLAGDAVRIMRERLSYDPDGGDPVAGLAEEPAAQEVFKDFDISQPTRFASLIEGITGPEPALHLLHILLPHVPYEYLPSGGRYQGPVPDIGRRSEVDMWGDEAWPTTLGRQRHVLQAGYADRLVGDLVDTLRDRGAYDDALIVVVADHGISFEASGPIRGIEGQALSHDAEADIMWVPFILKEPGQTHGQVSDDNVLTIDVLPTIAQVLDVELPWAVDGRSALGPPRSDASKPYHASDLGPFGAGVGEAVVVDGDRGWRRVLARSLDSVLPPGDGADRIWRVGPSPELVGERVADVEPGRLVAVDAALRDPDAFDDVRRDGFLPVLVRGRVDGMAHGEAVAVSVNGVVAATGPIFQDGDGLAFAVMVDDARLRSGSNEVAVYRIEGAGA